MRLLVKLWGRGYYVVSSLKGEGPIHLCASHSSLKKKITQRLHARHSPHWDYKHVCRWRAQSRQTGGLPERCVQCHGGMWPGSLGRVSESSRAEVPGSEAAPQKSACWCGSICWECQSSDLNLRSRAGWVWRREILLFRESQDWSGVGWGEGC